MVVRGNFDQGNLPPFPSLGFSLAGACAPATLWLGQKAVFQCVPFPRTTEPLAFLREVLKVKPKTMVVPMVVATAFGIWQGAARKARPWPGEAARSAASAPSPDVSVAF
jgi:hypothetical protein